MRIAIVEDEIRIREGIHRLLEKTDPSFEIVGEAENGADGVELLLGEKPDLVLADIRMPEMDGIEMLEAVHGKGLKPMVIVLSAYSDFSYAQQAMKLGVREYLVKPIVVDELIGAVRRAHEALRQQSIVQQGRRSRSEVLSAALYSEEPLSETMRGYVRQTFGLHEETDFALLVMRFASGLDFPAAQKLRDFVKENAAGECTILPADAQGCMPCIFEGCGADWAKLLEKKLLPVWRTEADFTAQIAFCKGLQNLHMLFSDMLQKMDYGLLGMPGMLIRTEDVGGLELEMLSYPIETENAVRRALARHDTEAVRKDIGRFGEMFENGKLYAPRDIKEAHVRFALSLLNTAHDLGYPIGERISRQELLDHVMSSVHPSELTAVRKMLADSLQDVVRPKGKTGLLVRRAQSLMQDFYAQGITLEEIAQRLSVTPEYLGSQIHRETGMTFGMLMKQLRVEQAKKLFLTTDKKLYEAAQMVGYADAKYFSKVFQSVTGMLPAEYRRLNK